MKKSFVIYSILIFTIHSFAQVKGVTYTMKSGFYTNTFEVYIKITEGSATSNLQRSQFGSQITIVTPKEISDLQITSFMPLQNNQNYNSTTPVVWISSLTAQTPAVDPDHNYFTINPALTPTSLYNNIKAGDEIKLFSFKTNVPACYSDVRFYKNNIDANDMNGADFKNGFVIGNPIDVFKGLEDGMSELIDNNTLCENTILVMQENITSTDTWNISDLSKLKIENNKLIPLDAGTVKVQFVNQNCLSPNYDIQILSAPTISIIDNEMISSAIIGESKWYDCNTNTLLQESADSSFFPPYSGSFYAEIVTDFCNVKTDCLSFLLSNTSDVKSHSKIYPSISSGKFNIQVTKGDYLFEVYDMDGKKYIIKNHNQNLEVESLDISELNNGLYLLKLSGSETLSQKVIISKN